MAKKTVKIQDRIKKNVPDNEWFRNAAKSLGFTSAEIVKDLMPATSDFLSYNKSDAVDLVKELRSNTNGRNMIGRQFKNIPQIKAAVDVLNNARADIKSGKFYNMDRLSEFDDDMDFEFGDLFGEDGGVTFFDDEEDLESQPSSQQPTVIDTLPLAKVVSSSTEATVNTMIAVADQQMAFQSEKLMFDHRATSSLLGGISSINDNLATLVQFNSDSTAKYHAASLKFYEESLDYFKKVYDNPKEEDIGFGTDLYTHTGGLKLSNYMKEVKKNLADYKDENAMLGEIWDTITNVDTIKGLAKNPIGTIVPLIIKQKLPDVIKSTTKAVDDSLSAVIPAVLAKINTFDGNDNQMLDTIYKIFGSKAKLSYDVDLGKYEKGAISWDGESKKALVEVIPAYLRRIESALTGSDERIYNFDKGKFAYASTIRDDIEKEKREKEVSGFKDTRSLMRNVLSELRPSMEVREQFEKDMDEYFAAMTEKGSLINPFAYTNKHGVEVDDISELGLFDNDRERAELMRRVLKGLSTSDLTKMATVGIHDSRNNTQRYMEKVRLNPTLSGYSALYNDVDGENKVSYKGGILGKTDMFGLTQLDYLRDIRSALINGIRVFPDTQKRYRNWQPNLALMNREREENRTVREREERENAPTMFEEMNLGNTGDDLRTILARSEEEWENIHKKTNGTVEYDGDNKLIKGANKLSSIINTQVYNVLFGDELTEDDAREMVGKIAGVGGGKSLLSSITGFFKDTVKGVGSYFTGKPYVTSDGVQVEGNPDSIMGKISSFFSGAFDKAKDIKNSGIFSKITTDFMDGFDQFKVNLFGEKKLTESGENRKQTFKEFADVIKPRLPKAIGAGLGSAMIKTALASKLGILGSVLLPGGPIGAALVGTSVSLLSQSETFKKWAFGDLGEDGSRSGGVISKELQDKFKDNKKSLAKGAGIGFISSFFLPGGPITGALLGMGGSIVAKNEAFQEFLYGKDFKDKKKKSLMDGAFGKVYRSMLGENANPKLATFLGASGMGIGLAQGVGLLPSFLLPGGPIMGSMLGLAAGITASSDKFQNMLFGEKDVDGKRYGGLFTQLTNWFSTSFMQPLKIKATELNDKLYGFLKGKVFDPIIMAFEPIKQAGKFLIEDAKNAIIESFTKVTDPVIQSFRDHVTKPLGDALKKVIVNPLKKIFKGIFSGIGKLAGAILTSPIKMISAVGSAADRFNERHVIKDEKKRRRAEYEQDIQENGMTIGKWFKGFGVERISKEDREKLINEKLSYRNGKTYKEAKKDKKQELKEELAKRAEKRADLQRQFEEDKAFGKASGWKYASKSQKEKREQELKEKSQWMQEKALQEAQDTGEKVGKVSNTVDEVNKNTFQAYNVLNDIYGLLKDNLKALGKKTGMSDVIDELRDKGQSHADGLEEVPKDGYVAELHKGEMVVPSKPAGVLRNIFGSGASLISKMMSDEAKDRNDNALGLTDEEAEQRKELQDQDRKAKVSRKNVDFLQNQLAAKKKEKEEKKWKDDILSAIHGVGDKVTAGAAAGASLFDKLKDLFSNMPSGIVNGIGSILQGLGIGGSLATIAGPLMGKWADYQNSEEYITSRTDADGKQVFDNANYEIGKKFLNSGTRKAFAKPIKVAKEKIVDPIVDVGKKAYNSKTGQSIIKGTKNVGNKIATGAKSTVTKIDNYINPKKTITGKSFLGTNYSYATDVIDKSARKGIAKPLGAVSDAVKATKDNAKSTVAKFIDVAKKALGFLSEKVAEKFPKVAKFISKADTIFAKMLKNCDDIVKKFSKKISSFLTSSALKSNPVGLALDAVLAVGDFISGLTAGNAGNLFGVSKQNVDGKMRGITAVLQTACNFSWMGVIWIINEITNSMFGINFIRSLAVWIYNAIPGDKIDTNDSDISNCDSIESALGVLGVTADKMYLFKKGDEWKDFSKAKNEEFEGLISAREQMELARLQYNLEHGTSLDSDAWVDKESQTLGGKVLDTITKPFKKTNAQKEAKYQKKVDKYSAKVAKYEEKVENSNFLTKGWNKMLLNYNKKKLEKNEKKLTTYKNVNEKAKAKKSGNTTAPVEEYVNYNAASQAENQRISSQRAAELAAGLNLYSNGQLVQYDDEGNILTGDAGTGEEDPYGVNQAKKIEKEGKTKESKTVSKILMKSGQNTLKMIKNYGSVIGKGLQFNVGLVSKAFKGAQEGLSKVAKKTSKTITNDSDKTSKELTTENKGLLSAVKNSFNKVKEKVQGITGSLSNIQIGSISLGDIGDSLTNGVKTVVEKVFGWLGLGGEEDTTTKSSSSTTKKDESWLTKAGNTVKSWFNFGKSGSETRTKSNRESGYIQPTNTTNNTSNTNNKFVFYSQSDSRWGNNRIGGTKRNMTQAGCGPTSLAMAISQMTGEEITPDTIARLGKDYLPGYSEYKLFPEIAKKFGMNYFDTADATEIMDSLKSGKPVILSGKTDGKGMTPYTKEGHIVVANHVDGNRVFINDPRGKEFSGYYDISTIMNGLNRGMVLSPSAQMNVNKYSNGKVEGWKNPTEENPNRIPLLYGDSEFTNMEENLGGTPGQVRVADRVLSYARAFLANTSKFKYSQAQSNTTGRYGIDNNNIGADCSSFVSHVLSVAGDTGKISYLSQSFWDEAGYKVDDPQIGDVVCQQGHVGLYSGDGKYIHMSGRKDGIKESKAIQRGNNKHRGYKRVLKNPDAMVDATITGGNSLLGTVVATESGNPVTSGGGTPADGTTGSIGGSQPSGVEQMGVFAKLGNIGNNLMASIFNGKEVDMYASAAPADTTSTPGGTVDISGSPNTRRAVWDFFTGMGYSKEATAGIMGNFQQESGIDPKIIQGGGKGPAAGIAQWENYNKKSARWADLNKYAQSKGKDWTDLQTQLEFVHKELEGSAPDTYTASLLKKRGGVEKLKSLTNVKDAVHMFEETFERAGKPMWENRYKYANSIYNEFANSSNAGAGGYATATAAETAPTDGSIPSSMNGWAYYKQTDPKWQNGANGRVGKQGCGMSSHAMMLTTMFGKEITPVTVGEWAIKNGQWPGGMSWTMPPSIAKTFNLDMPLSIEKSNGASNADLDKVKAEIKAGRPVILSGTGKSKDLNTPFTTGGHIVLAVGVDGQNRLIINDPRGPQYTKAYEDSGVMDIGTGLRGAWSFEKTSGSIIPTDWTTGSDFAATPGAIGITGDTSSVAAPSIDQMGVFAKMGNIGNNLMASIFNGKQVDMYGSTSTSPSSGTPATGTGKFPTYNLNDAQLKGIANILQHEQPGYEGMQAEASLMANLVDMSGDDKATVDNLVKKATGGWFAKGKSRFNNPGNPNETAMDAARKVLIEGKRTVPRYVNEHDCFSDLTSVTTDGKSIKPSDRSAYKPHNTKISNRYGAKGIFHSFPNSESDPFYYTSEENRKKWGDDCYTPTPPGDAGMGEGDGKTYWANVPKTTPAKVSYTKEHQLTGADKAAYVNAKRAVDKLNRQMTTNMNNQGTTAPKDYADILAAIVEQLQAISNNTANTAKGISEIEIVSANEPVYGGSRPMSGNTKNKSIDTRQANSNTGYDIARKMASYK